MINHGISFGLLCILALSATGARAEIIILKETDKDGQPKRMAGRVVDKTGVGDKEMLVVESEGKRRVVLKSKIERIEPSLNERELESLSPSNPTAYFDLGVKYAQQANELNDREARDCARHLFQSALELDEKRFGIDVHMQLAQICDDEESVARLIQVLRIDPQHSAARDQLRETMADQVRQSGDDFVDLRPKLQLALRDDKWAPLVSFAKSAEAQTVFKRLALVFPGVQPELAAIALPSDCPQCKGSTLVKCGDCRGGRVPCTNCRGRGSFSGTQTSGFTDPVSGNYITKSVPVRKKCTSCSGQKTFPCPKLCKEGSVNCTACAARQNRITVSTGLRQKLADINSVLAQPAGSSWAQTLIVEHRASFRPISTARDMAQSLAVEGRFYRRLGRWEASPQEKSK